MATLGPRIIAEIAERERRHALTMLEGCVAMTEHWRDRALYWRRRLTEALDVEEQAVRATARALESEREDAA